MSARDQGAAPSRPIKLSAAYIRLIRLVERLPANQTGSDKTWVERLLRETREHYRKAVRVR